MNENDYKKTLDKVNMSAEKKNDIANGIIIGDRAIAQNKNGGYRARGKQAAILVLSMLLVYAVVFAAVSMFSGGSDTFIPPDTSSEGNNPAQGSEESDLSEDKSTESKPSESSAESFDESEDISSEPQDIQTLQDMRNTRNYEPAAYVVTSARQLETLGWKNSEYDLSAYDDGYFNTKGYLVITYFTNTTGSFQYEVSLDTVKTNTDKLVINVRCTNPHLLIVDTALGFYCYVTEVDGRYSGQEVIYNSKHYLTLQDMIDDGNFEPAAYIVTSPEQLQALKRDEFGYSSRAGSFFEADLSVYDDKYFDSNRFLVITYFSSSSGGDRYEARGMFTAHGSETLTVSVRCINKGMDDNIGFNCFITEVDGNYYGMDILYDFKTEPYVSLWDLYEESTLTPAAYVVTSPGQLEALDWSEYGIMGTSGSLFEADLSLYDDEYFENRYLVITYFISSSGSYRYEAELGKSDANEVVINVTRVSPTKEQLQNGLEVTDDEGFNCFITEIEGAYTGQEIKYNYSEA